MRLALVLALFAVSAGCQDQKTPDLTDDYEGDGKVTFKDFEHGEPHRDMSAEFQQSFEEHMKRQENADAKCEDDKNQGRY